MSSPSRSRSSTPPNVPATVGTLRSFARRYAAPKSRTTNLHESHAADGAPSLSTDGAAAGTQGSVEPPGPTDAPRLLQRSVQNYLKNLSYTDIEAAVHFIVGAEIKTRRIIARQRKIVMAVAERIQQEQQNEQNNNMCESDNHTDDGRGFGCGRFGDKEDGGGLVGTAGNSGTAASTTTTTVGSGAKRAVGVGEAREGGGEGGLGSCSEGDAFSMIVSKLNTEEVTQKWLPHHLVGVAMHQFNLEIVMLGQDLASLYPPLIQAAPSETTRLIAQTCTARSAAERQSDNDKIRPLYADERLARALAAAREQVWCPSREVYLTHMPKSNDHIMFLYASAGGKVAKRIEKYAITAFESLKELMSEGYSYAVAVAAARHASERLVRVTERDCAFVEAGACLHKWWLPISSHENKRWEGREVLMADAAVMTDVALSTQCFEVTTMASKKDNKKSDNGVENDDFYFEPSTADEPLSSSSLPPTRTTVPTTSAPPAPTRIIPIMPAFRPPSVSDVDGSNAIQQQDENQRREKLLKFLFSPPNAKCTQQAVPEDGGASTESITNPSGTASEQEAGPAKTKRQLQRERYRGNLRERKKAACGGGGKTNVSDDFNFESSNESSQTHSIPLPDTGSALTRFAVSRPGSTLPASVTNPSPVPCFLPPPGFLPPPPPCFFPAPNFLPPQPPSFFPAGFLPPPPPSFLPHTPISSVFAPSFSCFENKKSVPPLPPHIPLSTSGVGAGGGVAAFLSPTDASRTAHKGIAWPSGSAFSFSSAKQPEAPPSQQHSTLLSSSSSRISGDHFAQPSKTVIKDDFFFEDVARSIAECPLSSEDEQKQPQNSVHIQQAASSSPSLHRSLGEKRPREEAFSSDRMPNNTDEDGRDVDGRRARVESSCSKKDTPANTNSSNTKSASNMATQSKTSIGSDNNSTVSYKTNSSTSGTARTHNNASFGATTTTTAGPITNKPLPAVPTHIHAPSASQDLFLAVERPPSHIPQFRTQLPVVPLQRTAPNSAVAGTTAGSAFSFRQAPPTVMPSSTISPLKSKVLASTSMMNNGSSVTTRSYSKEDDFDFYADPQVPPLGGEASVRAAPALSTLTTANSTGSSVKLSGSSQTSGSMNTVQHTTAAPSASSSTALRNDDEDDDFDFYANPRAK